MMVKSFLSTIKKIPEADIRSKVLLVKNKEERKETEVQEELTTNVECRNIRPE